MPKGVSLTEKLTDTNAVEKNAHTIPPDLAGEDVVRMIVTAPQGLNMRTGPALDYDVVTVLPDAMELNVWPTWAYGRGGKGWFEIHIPGWVYAFNGEMCGWVKSSYLALLPPARPL